MAPIAPDWTLERPDHPAHGGQSKTVFVLAHTIREAVAADRRGIVIGGAGKTARSMRFSALRLQLRGERAQGGVQAHQLGPSAGPIRLFGSTITPEISARFSRKALAKPLPNAPPVWLQGNG